MGGLGWDASLGVDRYQRLLAQLLQRLWEQKQSFSLTHATAAALRVADAWAKLRAADGILVPGGFGGRGVEGKILAANYARTHDKPYLGICLGMQVGSVASALCVVLLGSALACGSLPPTTTYTHTSLADCRD